MLLAHLFERIISVGRLRIVDASGRLFTFEGSSGSSVTIRLHDQALHWKLLVRPRLVFRGGEFKLSGGLQNQLHSGS